MLERLIRAMLHRTFLFITLPKRGNTDTFSNSEEMTKHIRNTGNKR